MDPKPWTVMVYMMADTGPSFLHDANNDIEEMKLANTGKQTNVLVQVDGPSDGPVMRYQIEGGKRLELASPRARVSRQPGSLLDFADMCRNDFPAHNYLLVLWGHGQGIDWMLGSRPLKAIFPQSRGSMTLDMLGQALEELHTAKDELLVGFDACLMGMVEVYFEIQKSVGWVVGGADEIPITGWPYQPILRQLEGGDGMSPKHLAQTIATKSLDWYNEKSKTARVSFSACDLEDKLCAKLAASIKTLGIQLTEYLKHGPPEAIGAARCFAEDYKEEAFIDLNAFCSKLQSNRRLPKELQEAASNVCQQLIPNPNGYVIHRGHSKAYPSEYIEGSGAVSVCFPSSPNHSGSLQGLTIDWELYKKLHFNRATDWCSFLDAYYKALE